MTEDITKGRKSRKRLQALEALHQDSNHPTPGHEAAAGHQDVMEASVGKGDAGNPVANMHSPTGSYAADRVSEPLTAGHAAYSTGDHGLGAGRSSDIAVGQHGMNIFQGGTGRIPFASMNAIDPNSVNYTGAVAMGGIGQDPASVHLDVMPAAERAGLPHGLRAPVSGRPNLAGTAPRIAPQSATPANPSMPSGQQASASRSPMSAKAESSPGINVMKAAVRESLQRYFNGE